MYELSFIRLRYKYALQVKLLSTIKTIDEGCVSRYYRRDRRNRKEMEYSNKNVRNIQTNNHIIWFLHHFEGDDDAYFSRKGDERVKLENTMNQYSEFELFKRTARVMGMINSTNRFHVNPSNIPHMENDILDGCYTYHQNRDELVALVRFPQR